MADLTPERIAELRRIAEAATPGPWEVALGSGIAVCTQVVGWRDGKVVFVADCLPDDALDVAEPDHRPNLDYIAACDPPTVLTLLDEIEQLRQEREQALIVLEQAVNGIRWWMDAHPESASGADDEWLYEAEQILRPGEQQEVPDDA